MLLAWLFVLKNKKSKIQDIVLAEPVSFYNLFLQVFCLLPFHIF